MPLGMLKTLEGEWYVAIKAYKFTIFDIFKRFFVLSYVACLYLYFVKDLYYSYQITT